MDLTAENIKFADRYSCKLCQKSGAWCNENPLDCPIVASGREGLVIAANSYDGSSPFNYWAKKIITKCIVDYYREMFGKQRQVEDFKKLCFFPYNNNAIELSRDGIENRVILKDLFNKRLSPGQKYRFYQRYILGIPTKEMAARDGVGKQAIDISFHNIKKHIREILSTQEKQAG